MLDKNDTNIHNKRGVDGENETALVLAQNGYSYAQGAQNKKKRADGSFEGVADGSFKQTPGIKSEVYSPSKNKNIRGIKDEVARKVAAQNSPYFIVRLEAGGQSVEDLKRYFNDPANAIEGLKQLFVVKEGKLYMIY